MRRKSSFSKNKSLCGETSEETSHLGGYRASSSGDTHWAKKLLVLYSLQKVEVIVIQDGPSEPFSCCGYLGSKGQVQGLTILWVSSRGSWCVGGGYRADPEDTRPEVGAGTEPRLGLALCPGPGAVRRTHVTNKAPKPS